MHRCTLPAQNKQAAAPLGSWQTHMQPSDLLSSQGSGCVRRETGLPVQTSGDRVNEMLSESCQNDSYSIHLQLLMQTITPLHAPLFLPPTPSLPFPSTAYIPSLHPLSSHTNLHSLSLWNSSSPTRLFCTHACAVSFHGEAPFTRQSQNKWWSAVQNVGSSSSVNMDDWTQAEGKCVSV